jgi:hypothetical protein
VSRYEATPWGQAGRIFALDALGRRKPRERRRPSRADDREIRRRTRVVGSFPDGQSALNLAAARLHHITGTARSTKRYLNIELLKDQQMRGAITA